MYILEFQVNIFVNKNITLNLCTIMLNTIMLTDFIVYDHTTLKAPVLD